MNQETQKKKRFPNDKQHYLLSRGLSLKREELVLSKINKNYYIYRKLTSRHIKIFKQYLSGETLEKIGRKRRLTRERVRQIINSVALYKASEAAKEGRFVIDLKEYLQGMKRMHKLAKKARTKEESTPRVNKPKRWSRYYDYCRICRTTIIPHASHGYCKKCYPKTNIFKELQEASRLRNIEKRREYEKEYSKKYHRRPEVIERKKEYYKRPETIARLKKYRQEYYKRPKVKERIKKYYQRPDVKEKNKERNRERYIKKKRGIY